MGKLFLRKVEFYLRNVTGVPILIIQTGPRKDAFAPQMRSPVAEIIPAQLELRSPGSISSLLMKVVEYEYELTKRLRCL